MAKLYVGLNSTDGDLRTTFTIADAKLPEIFTAISQMHPNLEADPATKAGRTLLLRAMVQMMVDIQFSQIRSVIARNTTPEIAMTPDPTP